MCSLESFEKRLEVTGKTPVNLGQDTANVRPPFDEVALKTIKVTIHQHFHTERTSRKEKVGNTLNYKSTGYHKCTTWV